MLKDIKNFEKYYSIDENGNVFSKIRNKYLKLNYKKNGYIYVSLQVNNIKTTKRVHRLVAEAFIPNPENKPFVNHIDGNKSNNNVQNLEWVTGSENNIHAMNTGLFDPRKQCHTYELIDLNGDIINKFKGRKDLMDFIGLKSSTVNDYIKFNKGIIKSGKYKGYKIVTYK